MATTLLKGEHVDKLEFDTANEKAVSKGDRPAQGEQFTWYNQRHHTN